MTAITPDWSRERPRRFWDPGRKLINTIRDYQRIEGRSAISILRRKFVVARWRFWSAVTSCDIPLTAQIEGGLILPHPVGIVIHPAAIIGPNCLIHQNATIGVAGGGRRPPEIAGLVDIGANAVVFADVGRRAIIGANAVVTSPIPAEAVVVGAPARIVRMRGPLKDCAVAANT